MGKTKVLHRINLDFGCARIPDAVFAKQNDSHSRFLEITPFFDGAKINIENGVTARFRLTKPDGVEIENDAVIKEGVILVELTEQVLSAPGLIVADIVLCQDEAVLSSMIFYIHVVKSIS